MTWIVVGVIGAFLLVLFNVYASLLVRRAEGFERSQKRNQLLLVWLVPIIGALIVAIFHTATSANPRDEGDNGSEMTDQQLISNVWTGAPRK